MEARRVSEKIIDAGLDIRWCARVRLDPSFSPTLLDVMAEAGANSFHLAPETFSAETANLHNKGYDVDHIKGIFEYWEDNRDRLPPLTARLMVGFPGETFESFLASYEYIERHRFHIQAVSFFSLFKNSTIYERPGDYGITIEKKKQPRVLFANFVATWSEENAIELQKIREFITTRRNDLRKRILFLHPTKRVQTPTEGETSVVDFGSAYKVDQFLGLLQSFYAV